MSGRLSQYLPFPWSVRNYPSQTIQGTSACEAASLFEPGKKFWKIHFLRYLFLKFHFIDFQLLQFLKQFIPLRYLSCFWSIWLTPWRKHTNNSIKWLWCEFLKLFSLVQVQNQSFGPKQNANFTVDTHKLWNLPI